MSIPKEVISDLLPIYLAGEVSPVTRQWLEEQLADHPQLAEQARKMHAEFLGAGQPPLPPELELVTLQRTRRTLGAMRWLFGFGIALTACAFALRITIRPAFAVRPLLFDYPAQLGLCVAAGALCWIGYFRLKRSLRVK